MPTPLPITQVLSDLWGSSVDVAVASPDLRAHVETVSDLLDLVRYGVYALRIKPQPEEVIGACTYNPDPAVRTWFAALPGALEKVS